MRDIKFRAWDGKRIIYLANQNNDTSLVINEDHWQAIDHLYGTPKEIINSHTNKEAVLMQFTGLPDKNGKEIYEDDILTIPVRRSYDPFDSQTKEIVQVCFKDGVFGVYSRNVAGTFDVLFDYHEECEIIGNIYEDAELIEKDKVTDVTRA